MRLRAGILGALLAMGMAGSAAADEAFCNAYADEAAYTAQQAKAVGCNFSGGRWTTVRAQHFNACMGGAGDTRNGGMFWMNEFATRASDLAKCWASHTEKSAPFSSVAPFRGDDPPTLEYFCRAYAYISDRQMAGAVQTCGFSGAMWQSDFDKNLKNCMQWGDQAGSNAGAALFGRTKARVTQCTGGSVGSTCEGYAQRMDARLAEAKSLNCSFVSGSGGWDKPHDYWVRQCLKWQGGSTIKYNEDGLQRSLDKCKAGGGGTGTGGGGTGGGTIMTGQSDVTMYDTYKKGNKDLCYIVAGDKLTLLAPDGNSGKWLRLKGNSGNCKGKTGYVYNDGELK